MMEISSQGQQDQKHRLQERDPRSGRDLHQGTGRRDAESQNMGSDRQDQFDGLLTEALKAVAPQPVTQADDGDLLEELVSLSAAVAGAPESQTPTIGGTQQRPTTPAEQQIRAALDQLDARTMGAETSKLQGQMRFDLALEGVAVREATLSMTKTEITLTLHSTALSDPSLLSSIARDMASLIQQRHPGKTIRVLSDLEEAQETKPEFNPLLAPVKEGAPSR